MAGLNPSESVENTRKPGRLVVEVGAGGHFYRNDIGGGDLQDNDVYLALDVAPKSVRRSKELVSGSGSAEAAVSNAQEMPLRSESVDELVLADVLNAPLEEYMYSQSGPIRREGEQVAWVKLPDAQRVSESKDFDNHGFDGGDTYYILAQNIIDEAVRVLKPGGRIVVIEKYDIAHEMAYQAVLERLGRSPDFTVQAKVVHKPIVESVTNKVKVCIYTKKNPRQQEAASKP